MFLITTTLILTATTTLTPNTTINASAENTKNTATVIVWETNQTLTEDYIVPPDTTLTVTPNVTIHVNNGVKILVQGALNATGTVFTWNNTGIKWWGLDIIGTTTLTGCKIIGSGYGIHLNQAKQANIADTTISNNGFQGIMCYNTNNIIIENCTVKNSVGHGIFCYYANPIITNSRIIGCGQNAINLYSSSPMIINNILENNTNAGIAAEVESYPIIRNTTITGNTQYGLNIKDGADAEITSCNITGNSDVDLCIAGTIRNISSVFYTINITETGKLITYASHQTRVIHNTIYLSNTLVIFVDRQNTTQLINYTDQTGSVTAKLPVFIKTSMGTTYYTPYIITAEYHNYTRNTIQNVNISIQYISIIQLCGANITLSIFPDNSTPVVNQTTNIIITIENQEHSLDPTGNITITMIKDSDTASIMNITISSIDKGMENTTTIPSIYFTTIGNHTIKLFFTSANPEDILTPQQTTLTYIVSTSPILITSSEPPLQQGEENNKIIIIETVAPIIFIAAGAAGVGYFSFTETGKYKLLSFFLPLYSKIGEKNLFDNKTRDKIYDYVEKHPGMHLRQIMRETGVPDGAAVYHLRRLEEFEKIKSRNHSHYRYFWTKEMWEQEQIWKKQEGLTQNELNVYDFIKKTPGVTQQEISEAMIISRRTITYYLQKMVNKNIVKSKNVEDRKRYFINEDKIIS